MKPRVRITIFIVAFLSTIPAVFAQSPEEVAFNSGVAYHRNGDYDRAIADYSKALELAPGFVNAYVQRGTAYDEKGDHDQAIADYSKAIELKPRFAPFYRERAIVYDALGKYGQAIADYTKAIELDPQFVLAYGGRGKAYEGLGNNEQAIADYSKALEFDPKFTYAYFRRAVCFFFKNEFDKSWADVRKSRDLGYEFPPEFLVDLKKKSGIEKGNDSKQQFLAAFNKGISYLDKQMYDEAIVEFNKAIEINPRVCEVYINRGIAFAEKGDFKRAIADEDKAIEIDPRSAMAYYNRGNDRLRADFGEVLELNPGIVDARGIVKKDQGNLAQAISDFSKAIEIDPQYAKAYATRAIAYFIDNEYDKSLIDMEKAKEMGFKVDLELIKRLKRELEIEKNEEPAEPWIAVLHRGQAYYQKKMYAEAISEFNKAIELNPKSDSAYSNRGLAFADKGDPDQAISDYNKGLEINPGSSALYYNRGLSYDQKDDLTRAIADFDKAIELNPGFADAYCARGLDHRSQGNLPQAISDYSKAIEIDPRFVKAYNNRAVAYFVNNDRDKSLADVNKAQELGYKVDPEFIAELKKESGSLKLVSKDGDVVSFADLPAKINGVTIEGKSLCADPVLMKDVLNYIFTFVLAGTNEAVTSISCRYSNMQKRDGAFTWTENWILKVSSKPLECLIDFQSEPGKGTFFRVQKSQ